MHSIVKVLIHFDVVLMPLEAMVGDEIKIGFVTFMKGTNSGCLTD